MQGKKLNKTCFLRKMTAWLLAVALAVPSVLAAETGQPPPEIPSPQAAVQPLAETLSVSPADPSKHPTIHLEQNLTKDGFDKTNGFFEVALKAELVAGETLRSVGVVLSYDPTLVTLVDWSGTAITLGSANYGTYVPAKKSDLMSAGVALSGGSATHYLYLGAESVLPQTLTGDSVLAVARFKCVAPLTYSTATSVFQNASGQTVTPVRFVDETSDTGCFSLSRAKQNVWVETGTTSLYYTPKTGTVDVAPPTGTGTIPKPNTGGQTVLSYDKLTTTYSYLTNLLPPEKIKQSNISAPSYDQSGNGIKLADVATVAFFDWDDSLLGAIAVAKGVDNRKIINDYVKTTFVHPELQSSAAHASLARKDTYRGEYPCEGPGVGATFPDGGANPGSKYALTNKLDYAFYGRSKDPAYPYVNGWQAVTPQTMANTWTALETGYTPPTTVNFQNITESTVYAKAIYEPGVHLNGAGTGLVDNLMRVLPSSLKYNCYGGISETSGNYSIKFQYARINEAGYGVTRVPGLSLRITMTPDVQGGLPFYVEVKALSTEKINVEVVPAKTISKIGYQMTNTSNISFVVAADMSKQNVLGEFVNYTSGVGSDGFVKQGTLVYLAEQVYIDTQVGGGDLWALNEVVFQDAGLRNQDGTKILDYGAAMNAIIAMEAAGYTAGVERMDFYQLQYAIAMSAYSTKANALTWYNDIFTPTIH